MSSKQVVDGEDVLCLIMPHLQGVSGAAVVTPTTDLWARGMDSLISVTVMIAVEDEYGIQFPDELLTREVFTTAENIAAAVTEARRVGANGERP